MRAGAKPGRPFESGFDQEPAVSEGVRPWYREPWPWVLIGILAMSVIASFITLWLALSNPDLQVVSDSEYQDMRAALRAEPQAETGSKPAPEPGEPDGAH